MSFGRSGVGQNNTKTFKNGNIYVTCDPLSFGDYDDSCAVERANVKVLKEEYPTYEKYYLNHWNDQKIYEGHERGYKDICPESKLIIVEGGFGSEQAWIRSDIDQEKNYLSSLTDYPSLNDEVVSEVENDIEDQSWESWIKHDLIKTLTKELKSLINEELDDNVLWECYGKAKEITNTYFEVESGGIGYIDIDKIKDEFSNQLIQYKKSNPDYVFNREDD